MVLDQGVADQTVDEGFQRGILWGVRQPCFRCLAGACRGPGRGWLPGDGRACARCRAFSRKRTPGSRKGQSQGQRCEQAGDGEVHGEGARAGKA